MHAARHASSASLHRIGSTVHVREHTPLRGQLERFGSTSRKISLLADALAAARRAEAA